jgi:membrane-bound lytic murein transglycosylase A
MRVLLLMGISVMLMAIAPARNLATPLKPIPLPADPLLGRDDRLWGQSSDRRALLAAIDHSLRYLSTPQAQQRYRSYPVAGFTQYRVRRSLQRFRTLVASSKSPTALQAAIQKEFAFYQAIGKDGQGTVAYTGYFEPTFSASRKPTAQYRYPLFRLQPS